MVGKAVKYIRSQSLLNEVKFPTSSVSIYFEIEESQSLLNEVKFPTNGVDDTLAVMILSQSLLNEVKFPTQDRKFWKTIGKQCRNPF